MPRADAGEKITLQLPTKTLSALVLAVLAAIGSPWAARLVTEPAEQKSADILPEMREDIRSLKQSREITDDAIVKLVDGQDEQSRILANIEGKLSVVTGNGWPAIRPPVGGIP